MIDKKQQPLILADMGVWSFLWWAQRPYFCLYLKVSTEWPGVLLISLGSPCLILKVKVLIAQSCPILMILVTHGV